MRRGEGARGAILRLAADAAVQDVQRRVDAGQFALGAPDLAHARQKDQHMPAPCARDFGPHGLRGRFVQRGQCDAGVSVLCVTWRSGVDRSLNVFDCDREGASGGFEDRRGLFILREVLRNGGGVQRGGHDDDTQVRPDGGLHFAQHGQGQVGVDAALVKLVEHDAAHAFKEGVVLQPAGEDAFGQDMQPRGFADLALEADGVADFFAEAPAAFAGDARGAGARGDAAGLQHQQRLPAHERGVEQGGGDARGLARAGRGDDHR